MTTVFVNGCFDIDCTSDMLSCFRYRQTEISE